MSARETLGLFLCRNLDVSCHLSNTTFPTTSLLHKTDAMSNRQITALFHDVTWKDPAYFPPGYSSLESMEHCVRTTVADSHRDLVLVSVRLCKLLEVLLVWYSSVAASASPREQSGIDPKLIPLMNAKSLHSTAKIIPHHKNSR